MLIAMVDGVARTAAPNGRGECPGCGGRVSAKCGSKVVWHWAHESTKDCDSWGEGETLWHAAWKSRFAKTEVTIRRGDEWHRADAVGVSGTVIEFQHSGISSEEIAEREAFYGRMVWVLDGTQAFENARIGLFTVRPEAGQEYVKFRWKNRRRSFDDATAPVYIDLGFSFKDVGAAFYKPSLWWDDGEDGLRDGVSKRDGWWQRASHGLYLLQVKKTSDGYGWGRLVSHAEFCMKDGGAAVAAKDKDSMSLRQMPFWDDYWDRFSYGGVLGMEKFKESCGYSWCVRQLKLTGLIKEET